jgi:hypothetical protein
MQTAAKKICFNRNERVAMFDLQNPERHPPHQGATGIVMIDTKAINSVSTHLYQI